jgi:hypothetical protein
MNLTKRGRGLLVGLGLAIIGVSGHAIAQGAEEAKECQMVEWGVDNVGAGTWELMIQEGWYGIDTDGAERLYSPACWEQGTDAGI